MHQQTPPFVPTSLTAVEQSKTFEEQHVEMEIMRDRAALADPSNSVHQMWVYDNQTALVARAKR